MPILAPWSTAPAPRRSRRGGRFRSLPRRLVAGALIGIGTIVGAKGDRDTDVKHQEFVNRMTSRGYTPRQVRRLVEWYMRINKAG